MNCTAFLVRLPACLCALAACTPRVDHTFHERELPGSSSDLAIGAGGVPLRQSMCLGSSIGFNTAYVARLVEAEQAPASLLPRTCEDAASCDEYFECQHIDASRLCTAGVPARCVDATHLEQCVGGGERARIMVVDCAEDPLGNRQCVTPEGGWATCGAGRCATPGSRCDGNVAVICANGIEQTTDCSEIGRTCVSGADSATCVDTVEACTDDTCDGDVWLECVHGLGYRRSDCRTLAGPNGTCVIDEYGSTSCATEMPECTSFQGECAGSVIRLCVYGTWEEFDCATFNQGTCRQRAAWGLFGPTFECVVP